MARSFLTRHAAGQPHKKFLKLVPCGETQSSGALHRMPLESSRQPQQGPVLSPQACLPLPLPDLSAVGVGRGPF